MGGLREQIALIEHAQTQSQVPAVLTVLLTNQDVLLMEALVPHQLLAIHSH